MRWPALLVATAISMLSGCAGAPELGGGVGRGLLAVDGSVPSGAEAVEKPVWKDGDWFRFLRGASLKSTLRVRSVDGGLLLVEDGTERETRFGLDFERLGERYPNERRPEVALAPADHAWTWPLWVGKRWTSHYAHNVPGGSLPVLADYHCDAVETITVPAGTFRCFRVWRHARPDDGGRYLDDSSVAWYAPEVGYVARRLADGVVTELEAWHRQR